MPFDNHHYNDAALGHPNLHHTRAPLIGPALGTGLRQAYLYARHHGRLLIDQNYALSFRDPTFMFSYTTSGGSSLFRIAGARKYIPIEIGVLVCEVTFRVISLSNLASAYHRIVLEIEGGASDIGPTVETEIPNPSERNIAALSHDRSNAALSNNSPFGIDSYTAEIQVVRANVTTDAVRHIYVEGNAEDRVSGTGVGYQPQHIAVWGEVRD